MKEGPDLKEEGKGEKNGADSGVSEVGRIRGRCRLKKRNQGEEYRGEQKAAERRPKKKITQ